MGSESIPDELITPEMLESFVAETGDLIDRTESILLEIEKSPNNSRLIDEAFRSIHTVKGNAGFFGFGGIEKRCMSIESVMDNARSGSRIADHKFVTEILSILDGLRINLGTAAAGDEEAWSGSADLPDEDLSEETEPKSENYKPLGDLLVEMGAVSEEDINAALDIQRRKIGEILIQEGELEQSAVEKVLDEQVESRAGSGLQGETLRSGRKDIRVNMDRLDKLFDLMGQLITAESLVVRHPELEGIELDSFRHASTAMMKITREMQEIAMAVRMIPLEGLFNKMRRLVRDLSGQHGKKIDLEIRGQDTEMDRNVIEEISNSLARIIRNAVLDCIGDTGDILLYARYEGNEIWITIRYNEKEPDGGKNRDSRWNEVHRDMQKLRGNMSFEKSAGTVTSVVLKIPLTLAIIDSITFRLGSMFYSIPVEEVVEFHKANKEQITRTGRGGEVVKLREKLIPIIELHRFYNIPQDAVDSERTVFIIIKTGQQTAALPADEIIGNVKIVIKPLPEQISQIRAVSGCSILGNGEISLIIDTNTLMKTVFM